MTAGSDTPPSEQQAAGTHQQPPSYWQQQPQQAYHYYGGPPHVGMAQMRVPVETNHTFHLLATVFTCGLWGFVWLPVWLINSSRRRKITTYQTSSGSYWPPPHP